MEVLIMRRTPFSMHSNTVSAGTGNTLDIEDNVEKIIFGVFGTAEAFSIGFEASMDGVNYGPYGAIDLGSYTTVSDPTSLNRLYQFEPEGIPHFRVNVKTLTNGTVNVLAHKVYPK